MPNHRQPVVPETIDKQPLWLVIVAITLLLPLDSQAAPPKLRVATFNVSLYRSQAGELEAALRSGNDPQIRAVAEIIQRVDPDLILLNEFDYDRSGKHADLFREHYLERSQHDQPSVRYEHAFSAPVNTGVDSGLDLDRNGRKHEAADAWGYGRYEGQYGMLVLSKYPIDLAKVRTFQHFRWQDMPDALLPDDPNTEAKADWYSSDILAKFPLSSKTHADVPIRVGDRVVHLLISHPTPPVFDGKEDRNGRRNHDEVRFWRDYIAPGSNRYIYDDADKRGGLATDASFVIAGDLNSDPHDGDSTNHPIRMLLESERINAKQTPSSEGAVEASRTGASVNRKHRGESRHDTGDFGNVGNMRLDYVLPSSDLKVVGSGVYWPAKGNDLDQHEAKLVRAASDHRLVWIDVELNPR